MNEATLSRSQELAEAGELAQIVGWLTDELLHDPSLGDEEILS